MGKRRRAREMALQYLYQEDFHSPGEKESELFWESQEDPPEVKTFAREIVEGVRERQEEIDRLIATQSQHWKLYRMTRIDRNILRIAVYEFLARSDIPPKVSIDEAIEIAKKFGTAESSAFINGLLDQIAKRLGKFTPTANSSQENDPSRHSDPQ